MEHLYRYIALPNEADPEYTKKMKRLKQTVTHNRHLFSSPKSFNDPFDCKTNFDHTGLTIADMRKYLMRDLEHLIKSGKCSPELAKEESLLISNDDAYILNCIDHINATIVNGMLNKAGILCFTEKPDSLLMWSHYADSHRGICLKFNKSVMEQLPYPHQKVDYKDELIKIADYVNDPNYSGMVSDFVTRKSSDWEYEKEWRIAIMASGDHTAEELKNEPLILPPNALVGIIFGAECNPDDQKQIHQWVCRSKVNECIKLYRSVKSKRNYAVEIKELGSEDLSLLKA